jgi:hypothetical protein
MLAHNWLAENGGRSNVVINAVLPGVRNPNSKLQDFATTTLEET